MHHNCGTLQGSLQLESKLTKMSGFALNTRKCKSKKKMDGKGVKTHQTQKYDVWLCQYV